MDLELRGRVALVAGASRGLGRAVSESLAAEGASLSLCSRDEAVLDETAEDIRTRYDVEVQTFSANVTREEDVDAWVAAARERFGKYDILVANAGGPPASSFETTSVDQWKDGLELNLLSTIYMCRAVAPELKERRSGRIVAITSISVKQPVKGLILSNTSRAGVAGFMKSLANELAPYGVTVNVVCPGYTRTDRLKELASRLSRADGVSQEDVYRRWTEQIPMGRLGEPEEFASVVTFLCSEKASYVTGTCLQIDGGTVQGLL